MPLRRLLFFTVLCVAALASAATALADSEPNNALVQAEGPISGGTNIAGTLGTPDDVDWFVFYVQGQQQLHLTSTRSSSDTDCAEVNLKDTNGASVADDFTTPPGTNRYFASVSNDDSCPGATNYTFKLEPGGAVVTGPSIARATPTGEPNETANQPAGPLAGGTPYSGSLDTSNDEDWFFFYTAPGTHPVDLAVVGPALSYCTADVELLDPRGERLGYVDSYNDYIHHITFTSQLADRYAVRVTLDDSGCLPTYWQFEIDPAESITTMAPSDPSETPVETPDTTPTSNNGPSKACRNARARVNRDLRAQRSVKRQLRHAHGAKRRRLKRKLRRVRHDLHIAVGKRRLHCSY